MAAASSRLAPQRARNIRLEPTMSVADALGATLAACMQHVRANIAGARRGKNPESLHQLRVAIRRMRAALSAYRDAMPTAERRAIGRALRHVERELGPARDWDVLIGKLDQAMQEDKQQERDFAGLIEAAEARRADAHGRLAKAFGHSILAKILRQIEDLAAARQAERALNAPIRDFAVQVLDARDRRARMRGQRIGSLGAKELHRLRICVKKLRYASEFFVKLWPTAETKGYVEALKQPQDALGDTQDAASARQLVAGIREEKQGELRHAARQTQRWIKAYRKHARGRVIRRWRDFEGAARFWRAF